MTDPSLSGPPATAGSPVSLFVEEASAGQVELGVGTAPASRVLDVRRQDVDLATSHFLPKHCRLRLEGPNGAVLGTGVVRRVRMTDPAPGYELTVRLDDPQPAGLDALRAALRPRPPEAAADAEAAVPLGSLPSWAARLVAAGDLTLEQLEQAAEEARTQAVDLEEALVGAGLVLESRAAIQRALDLGVPYVDASAYEVRTSNAELVPDDLAGRHGLFPLFVVDGVITLGMSDPTDLAVIDQVRLRASCEVDPCLALPGVLAELRERARREGGSSNQPTDSGWTPPPAALEEDTGGDAENATVRLVRTLIEDAAREGVSDVHIEPERDKLRVRVRVDGILHERAVHPLQHHAAIVSRLKVLAKLDIAESRKPQDGHFTLRAELGTVDVRVSTIPTVCGENVVLRLLLSDGRTIGLEELGLGADTLSSMQHFLAQPNGMILVTGPTGSGKTTTLYAALARLNTVDRKVVTVEDPVEKRVPLLRQTEVNAKAGLTFASGLRSLLRQDPDVIMVGEIRDRETAEISVQAALTGHLVLSTLHTNTAAGAIVRLSEMGVAPFMITSSLRAVIAQRLARRVCPACVRRGPADANLLRGLDVPGDPERDFPAAVGCSRCMQTGYRGRVGLYEMLELTPELSSALLDGASRDAIESAARGAVARDLRSDGLRRVDEGSTTLEEVARVAGLVHTVPTAGD